jgi:uncharacterized membrane protein
MVDFYNKYRPTIISILSALLTFFIALFKLNLGTKVGVFVSIVIVVLPVILSTMENKSQEITIKLLINAIEVIQKIIKNERLNDTNLKASKDNDNIVYDEYDIRKALTKGIE